MTRLFLHIGPHKTGSSYLQKTLVEHPDALAEAGLIYPQAGIEFMWGHHALAAALRRGQFPQARAMLAAVQDNVASSACGDTAVLLSSEDFDRLSDASLDRLADLLDKADLEPVVVMVRRPADEVLISSWQEEVKNGATASWSRYLWQHFSHPADSAIINPAGLLQRFQSALDAPVVVIDYAVARRADEDLFDVFAGALGLPALAGLGSGETINAMLAPPQVEIVRWLNVLAAAAGKPADCRISGALWRCLDAADDDGNFARLTQLAEQGSETVRLSGLPPLREFEQAFDVRFADQVINPGAGGGTSPSERVYRLPGEDLMGDDAALPLLHGLLAALLRHYQD